LLHPYPLNVDLHHEGTIKIRGEVIVSTIALEKLMDEVIARYFCRGEKKTALLEIVIAERMEFMKKADCVCEILTRFCNKHQKVFKTEFPKFLAEFQDIAKDRNRFAHQFDMPLQREEIKKLYVIVFMSFKNGIKRQGLTYKQVKAIIGRIEKWTATLDAYLKSYEEK
jgi:predicted nucleotidyltransferase component of viral defense system